MPSEQPKTLSSVHTSAPEEESLIDRNSEILLLKAAADNAITDQGRFFLLSGEAGIGKTRLITELVRYARSRGMQTFYGRCPALFKMNGVTPYSPWREIIKNCMQISTPEQLQKAVGYYPGEIFKIVPEIKQKLITFSESPPLSPDMERDRLFEAVSQFILNISKTSPLVVALDDLQWADSSSLMLLHYVARGIQSENILLIGAYRDTEIEENQTLTSVLAELNRARIGQRAQLKRLSPDHVLEMIKQKLDQTEVSKEFGDLVYEKTGGNPFFVEEVLASLKEEGIITTEGNQISIREVSAIEFPKTVKDVLKARLSRLDNEAINVLTMASFIGKDFSLEALSNVTDLEENKLLEILERILETGLLKCKTVQGEDTCSFADILIRDVLYDDVNPLKRKKLHNTVGCALEKTYSKNVDQHFGELASHFLEGGNRSKALDYLVKAGETAEKIYANDEAASYFESALKLLERDNIQRRAQILEVVGDIKKLTGSMEVSLSRWDEASQLWEQSGEKENSARVFRKMAYAVWAKSGNSKKAEDYYDKALKILEARPESVELASLYVNMGENYWHSLQIDKATALVDRALQMAEKLGAFEVIAHSHMIKALIYAPSNRKKANEHSEEALKIALKHNYIMVALQAYSNLSSAYFGSQNHERRRQCATEGYELAKRIGALSNQAWNGSTLASMYSAEGETDKALLLHEESIALNRRAGNLHQLPLSLIPLGACYIVLGDWEKGEKCLREALEIAQKTGDLPAIGQANWYLGQLYSEKREYTKAREFVEEMYKPLRKTETSLWQAFAAGMLAYISIEMGDLNTAEDYLKIIEQVPQELRSQVDYLVYARRAMILRAQNKWNESLEYFDKSLQNQRPSGEFWDKYSFAKRFLLEYARVYLERNQEGDRQKALALTKQALEMLQKLHARRDIEKVEAQITYLQTGRKISLEPVGVVATGYAPVDKLLNGGIPKGAAIVLSAPACDEKDVLIRDFLEAGVKNHATTFSVTVDPDPVGYLVEAFPSDFYLFACGPQTENVFKETPNVFLLKGLESLTNINIALTQAFHHLDSSSNDARRICLNVISDVLLQHGPLKTRKWLTELLAQLKSVGFTTLAVLNPQMHSSEELYAILSLFDGEIHIREGETDQGSARFIKIKRLSNQKYLREEIRLKEE